MLRADLEIALMRAGCALAFPRRYHKIYSNDPLDPDNSPGIGGGMQAISGILDEDLSEQHKMKVSARPGMTTEAVRCKKRSKCTGFIPEDDSEASSNKKSKYNDVPLSMNQEAQIFSNTQMKKLQKNRLFDDYSVGKYTGDQSISAPSVPKRNLKRKAETPTPADDFTNFTAECCCHNVKPAAMNAKILPKKRHSSALQIVTEDEPDYMLDSESMLEDELMLQLENTHIGTNLDVPIEEITPTEPIKDSHITNLSNNEMDSQSAISNTPKLHKLVKWTKKHWEDDQKEATMASGLDSLVVVHNLPIAMRSVYQQRLRALFEKYGQITHIEPAITHTTDEGESLFNTTIYFETETAATKALEEDHTRFGSSVIRVHRPLSAGIGSADQHVTFNRKSAGAGRTSGLAVGFELDNATRPGRQRQR